MADKRITIPVRSDIDTIRDRIAQETGIKMSYTQIFNFLIHFYIARMNEPRTQWAAKTDHK